MLYLLTYVVVTVSATTTWLLTGGDVSGVGRDGNFTKEDEERRRTNRRGGEGKKKEEDAQMRRQGR